MVQKSYPFDAGAGANILEDQWTQMGRLWLPSGVLSGELLELQGFGDSTGMQVKMRTGRAWIEGHFYENDAELALPIDANTSGNPRVDRLVARLDKVTNQIAPAIVKGAPGAAPAPVPAITQQDGGPTYEVPIARIAVANGAATIAAADVTEDRQFTGHKWRAYTPVWGSTGASQPVLGNGTILGRYRRLGRYMDWKASIFPGSTTAYGVLAWTITLPPEVRAMTGIGRQIGLSHFTPGGGSYHGIWYVDSGGTIAVPLVDNGAAGGPLNFPTGAVPAAFAAGSAIVLSGSMEIEQR